MCNPMEVMKPCTKISCKHHVGWGMDIIEEGERYWKFRSTPQSEAFMNCMCRITPQTALSSREIAPMYGISHQAVINAEIKAVINLKKLLKG